MNTLVGESLFSDHFDAMEKRQAQQRSTQLILGTGQPERAAEAVQIGSELGVPPEAVQGAPDMFRTQAEQLRATTALQGAPLMQQWLGQPVNGELAKDDLDNLTWFERNLGPAARALGRGTRRLSAAPDYLSAGADATRAVDVGKTFLQKKGVDLSTPEAAALVLQDRELFEEARALGAERGVIIALFDAMSGGVAGQTLLNNPAGDVVAQGLAQMILGSGGEATAQLATTGEIDAREVVIEGLAELATAPIEVIGVGGRPLLQELARFGRSGETATTIDEIDEVATASEVRGRSVDRFLSALEAAGVDEQSMYVSAEGLQEYFQAKDVELDAETLRAWGIEPLDYQEKLASGGDVTIPASNYAARISGTEDAEWFRGNAVFSPDEMSVVEAADFNSRVRDIMADAFDEAEAQRVSEESMRADDVQIYDQVFSDLRAAGRSPDVAKNEASVWSAFWRTMGERYGEAPLGLARSMGVRIQGPQTPEVARRRDQVDVMLNTLRSKGDRKPVANP